MRGILWVIPVENPRIKLTPDEISVTDINNSGNMLDKLQVGQKQIAETTNIESSQPPQSRQEPVVKQESARARPESPRNKPESPRTKSESPRNKSDKSPRNKSDKSPRTNEKAASIEASNSKPGTSRQEDSVNYENSGFEDYGDDFDEPDDEKNTIAKDTLNDRYNRLLNEDDDNDDDIDYDNL
jgi:hypothetical protein